MDSWRGTRSVQRTSSRIHALDIYHLALDPGIERNIPYASELLFVEPDEMSVDGDPGLMEEETGAGSDHIRASYADIFHLSIGADATIPQAHDPCFHNVVCEIVGSLASYFDA